MDCLVGTEVCCAAHSRVAPSLPTAPPRAGRLLPVPGRVSCSPHYTLAAVIFAAATLDFLADFHYFQLIHRVAARIPLATKLVWAHAAMLALEAVTALSLLWMLGAGMTEYSAAWAAAHATAQPLFSDMRQCPPLAIACLPCMLAARLRCLL